MKNIYVMSLILVAAMLLAAPGAAMGAVISHGDVTYINNETPPAGSAHMYPASPTLHLGANQYYEAFSDSNSESADQLADGVVTSAGGQPDANMVFWQEDRSGNPQYPDPGWENSGVDDNVWDGPLPDTTFNLGNVYTDLNSVEMWMMERENIGYAAINGIKLSFSADDITYSTPVLYNSAAYPSGGTSYAYFTVAETIGYNDPAGFQYVNIEWQPISGAQEVTYTTGYISIGEVTFDGVLIPEPATLALLGLGGLLTVLVRRRRA